MSSNPLRLATAKAIQQYRLTKLLPIYSDSELRDVVDAWYPILSYAGVKAAYLPDLFVFALMRRIDDKKIFSADDLAKSWDEFISRKRSQALQDYYDDLDRAQSNEELRGAAKVHYEKRVAET